MKQKYYFTVGIAAVLIIGVLVAQCLTKVNSMVEFEAESLTDLENPTWECNASCEDYEGGKCDIISVYGFPITCHDMVKLK